MSNKTVAVINAVDAIARATAFLDQARSDSSISKVDDHAALHKAWSHLAKAPQRLGLDPMTNARCNALTQANTALYAASHASTQTQADALTQTANALLSLHDQAAGVAWYSLPSTRREMRSETLRLNDRAENRQLLHKVVELLGIIAARSTTNH